MCLNNYSCHYLIDNILPMKISQEGIDVTKRFFEAIDILKAQKKIRGLQTFTNSHGINRWNMNTVKWNPDRSVLKPEWIVYLIRDYNISPNWILLGVGNMFITKISK